MAKRQKGFTLIEMMIVVGVVLILAIIAIPNMIRSKLVANETNAVAAMRTLATACNFYAMSKGDFPPDGALGFQTLYSGSPPYANFDYSLVGPTLNNPRDGYYYQYLYPAGSSNFSIITQPSKYNVTGTRSFYVDSTGVIRYCQTLGCAPSASSTALQ